MRLLKSVLFVACALPLANLIFRVFIEQSSADPVETITETTGSWTLNLLLLTLAVTPLRRLSGWNQVTRVRRMLGLYTFFYAVLHFLTYLVFDHFFDWAEIAKDIAERPYVTVGFTAFVLLIPLAITSHNKIIARLGGTAWKKLHKLVYAIAVLGMLHFFWLVKADNTEPLKYASVLAVLFALRLPAGRLLRWRGAGSKRKSHHAIEETTDGRYAQSGSRRSQTVPRQRGSSQTADSRSRIAPQTSTPTRTDPAYPR